MIERDSTLGDDSWWAEPALQARLEHDPASVLQERGIGAPAGLPPAILREIVRISFLLWVDGKIVSFDKFHIDPADEGLLFGRGVWESTRTINGEPWLWPQHLERLQQTARLLDIHLAPESLPDAAQVKAFVRKLTSQEVVVRLNVSAGRPGKTGMVWMSATLRHAPLTSVRLESRRTSITQDQPYAIWKTFQYASRLRSNQEAFRAGFDTALMLDTADNLLEAAHANLFVRLADGWATPPASCGLFLPGTVRQYLLQNAPLPIREQTVPYAQRGEFREAFVTNSNVGIVPVTQMDELALPIGDETKEMMNWLKKASGEPEARARK